MSLTDRPAAVRATGVRKSYGDKLVLDGVDLVVPAGRDDARDPNGRPHRARRRQPAADAGLRRDRDRHRVRHGVPARGLARAVVGRGGAPRWAHLRTDGLAVGFGLVAKNPEAASNLPMPLMFLPFLGSALVPPETMPAGVRWFAEYQPFTPAIETLRGLLEGGEVAVRDPVLTLAWTGAILLIGVLWSRALFRREPRS